MNKKTLLTLLVITTHFSCAYSMQTQEDLNFTPQDETLCENEPVISFKRTCLMEAIRTENFSEAKKIVAYAYLREGSNNRKAYVNKKDAYGATALHYAAQKKNLQIIKMLLEEDADPNAQDYTGKTPAHWNLESIHGISLSFNSFSVITYLLDNGASLFIEDQTQTTPLQILKNFENQATKDFKLQNNPQYASSLFKIKLKHIK